MRVIVEVVNNLSRKEQAWLNFAMGVAEKSDQRQRHGAVIVSANRVVSVGFNRLRNDPNLLEERMVASASHIHAESAAIRRGANRVSNGTIYVARINKLNEPLMSRPCSKCYEEIFSSGLKKLVYTT